MGSNLSNVSDPNERSTYSSLDPYDHLNTVKEIDLKRLEGTWWVMAHAPTETENGCDRSIRILTYDSEKNHIKMKTQCWRCDEISSEIDDVITFPYPNDMGKTKALSIQKKNDNLLWFHEIDYDNYVIVGDPKNHILWIWTRQEKVDRELVPFFEDKSAEYGYDPENLIVDSVNIFT